MAGWGNLLGKVADYVQGRSERRRNNIESLEKEQDALKAKTNKTARDKARLIVVADKLGKLYRQSKNQA